MGPDTRFIHAILGTVVTGLAIINPIMALFRPHPGTPRYDMVWSCHVFVKGVVVDVGNETQRLPYWAQWLQV